MNTNCKNCGAPLKDDCEYCGTRYASAMPVLVRQDAISPENLKLLSKSGALIPVKSHISPTEYKNLFAQIESPEKRIFAMQMAIQAKKAARKPTFWQNFLGGILDAGDTALIRR